MTRYVATAYLKDAAGNRRGEHRVEAGDPLEYTVQLAVKRVVRDNPTVEWHTIEVVVEKV